MRKSKDLQKAGGYMTKESFTYYRNRAKNKIKIKNSGLFSMFVSATDFCRFALLFDSWLDY